MIPANKLGWTAAVLELRGNVIRKKNQMRATPQLVLYVDSKNFDIIRELSRLTGTAAEAQKARTAKEFMRRGCSEHCPDAHVHVDDLWQLPAIGRWTITGAGAAVVLYNVLPYLVSTDKGFKEMMDETLENIVLTGQGSGATKATIKRLVSLGWELPSAIVKELKDINDIYQTTRVKEAS